jgi:hypothetical protein
MVVDLAPAKVPKNTQGPGFKVCETSDINQTKSEDVGRLDSVPHEVLDGLLDLLESRTRIYRLDSTVKVPQLLFNCSILDLDGLMNILQFINEMHRSWTLLFV